jgi:ribosome-associated protein YbcJ (S4-like RNA binding protein)
MVGLDIEVFVNTTKENKKNKSIVNGKIALVAKYTCFSKFNYQSIGL